MSHFSVLKFYFSVRMFRQYVFPTSSVSSGGRVGKSLTTRRTTRPPKNPPPGVRCEDILRKHESVPIPRSLFERKKKRFVFPAGSRCFMSNLFLCSANCVFQLHQFYTCVENFHRYFSVLMIFQILKRATRKRAKSRGERRSDKVLWQLWQPMWRQYGGNMAAVWRQCGGDVAAMWGRCGSNVWRLCGGNVASSPCRRHVVVRSSSCRSCVVAMLASLHRHVVVTSSSCRHHVLAMSSPSRRAGVVASLPST